MQYVLGTLYVINSNSVLRKERVCFPDTLNKRLDPHVLYTNCMSWYNWTNVKSSIKYTQYNLIRLFEIYKEKFENTKGVIRKFEEGHTIHYNGQKEKE